jgi:hypothetical protein
LCDCHRGKVKFDKEKGVKNKGKRAFVKKSYALGIINITNAQYCGGLIDPPKAFLF